MTRRIGLSIAALSAPRMFRVDAPSIGGKAPNVNGSTPGLARHALGMAHEARDEREDAEHAYCTSLEILGADRLRPEFGQTLLAYGRFKRGDDAAEGRRLLARARAVFAAIGATGWVAEADAALSPHIESHAPPTS